MNGTAAKVYMMSPYPWGLSYRQDRSERARAKKIERMVNMELDHHGLNAQIVITWDRAAYNNVINQMRDGTPEAEVVNRIWHKFYPERLLG